MSQQTYFAFPTFQGACLWYALWGQPSPPVPPTNQADEEPQSNDGESNADMADTDEQGQNNKPNETDESDTSDEIPFDEGSETEDQTSDTERTSEDTSSDPVAEFEDFEIDEGSVDDSPQIPYFKRETTDQGEEFVYEFPSWYDFALHCRDAERVWPAKDQASQRKGNEHWTGGADFPTAIRMALETGWPDGLKMLHDLETLVIPQPTVTEAWDFDVAGAFPSIPTYCAGDPACMITDLTTEHRAARPIVRIDFGKDCSAPVSPQAIMQRGAAGLSLANTLEKQGYSTELRIVGAARESNQTLRYSIVFKRAGDPLDLEVAAFAIAHPAVQRRMTLTLYEQHKELWKNFSRGYGIPLYQPNDPTSGKPGGAIFIPAPQGNETPDQSRKFVEECAQASGLAEALNNQVKDAA